MRFFQAMDGKATGYLLAVVLLSNLILFPSLTIYLGNTEQFATPLFDSLKVGVLLLTLLLLLLFLLGKGCPDRLQNVLHLILATLSIALWVQGSLMVWDIGVLDADAIVWAEHTKQSFTDYAVWALLVVMVIILVRANRGHLVTQAAVVLFLIQLFTIATTTLSSSSILRAKTSTYSNEALQDIASFSKRKNVLHIVVDAFQADVFEDLILSENRDAFDKSYQGFVYYREAMGVFPRTKYSVPAFLSGKVYDNEVETGYIEEIMTGKSIISVANDKAFEIDIVADGSFQVGQYMHLPHKNILDLNDLPVFGRALQESAKLLDMALFRVAPGAIKKTVYNDQKWLFSTLLKREKEFLMFEYFTNAIFLHQFLEAMAAERETPVYKYIHLFSTHGPKVVSKECRYAGAVLAHSRESYTYMAKCTLDSLAAILDKMKELGVYDDALIVLHADHGGWVWNHRQPKGDPTLKYRVLSHNFSKILPVTVRAAASPLLAIKYPGARGKIATSNKLASLLDIPDTINDAMEWGERFGHMSLLTLGETEKRKRYFRYYDKSQISMDIDYVGPMAEYGIEGSHYESPWKLEKIIMPGT